MIYKWLNLPPKEVGEKAVGKTVKDFVVFDTFDGVYFRIIFTDGSAILFKDPDDVDYDEADKLSDASND